MSAEGKKKRGMSGLANAASSPWRLNGYAPDWQARAMGVFQSPAAKSGGSSFMRGVYGGILAEMAGFGGFHVSDARLAHASDRCTHETFRDEIETTKAAAE